MTLAVARAEQIARDIRLLELARPDRTELPEFTPGAHVSVTTPAGHVRKYSLCNDPAERAVYDIAVQREENGRGGSASMFDDVEAGDTLAVSAPRNDFPLVPSPSESKRFEIAGNDSVETIRAPAAPAKNTRIVACESKYRIALRIPLDQVVLAVVV